MQAAIITGIYDNNGSGEIGFKLRGFDSKVNTQEIFLRTQDKDSSGKERTKNRSALVF